MYQIHRSVDISFAHHVRGHSGACINVHGHTWKFEVGVGAKTLDAEGFVVDFGVLKHKLLEPCHALLDHALAVGPETYREAEDAWVQVGRALLASRQVVHGPERTFPSPTPSAFHGAEIHYPGGMKVVVFPFAPTSERLAEWLYAAAERTLADDRVKVMFARIYETLHPVESVAEYRP